MILTTHKDLVYSRKKQVSLNKLKRRGDVENLEQPTTSKINVTVEDDKVLVVPSKLRSFKLVTNYTAIEDDSSDTGEDDMQFEPKEVIGGKGYTRKLVSVSDTSCILADRRLTSIRQKPDQLLSVENSGGKIAASPATVYRRRNQCRLKALANSEANLKAANALQLSYDGKRINEIDRYVFWGQFLRSDGNKCEVLGVKSFCEKSVTAEVICKAIVDETCTSYLGKIYSVMADTTSLNSGEISGINKILADYFKQVVGRDIHTLECMFHVNEIYFSHVKTAIEGKAKGPGAMQDGALLNNIKTIQKPSTNDITPRSELNIPITKMAQLHIKAKVQWFSEQKSKGIDDSSFRSDQMCLLALACYIVMDVPDNLKHLLEYKQEEISHARWVTTANGYLRAVIFGAGQITPDQRARLIKIASYILSAYIPSFFEIHLKPSAAQGPSITLFQRDLLFAWREIEPELVDVLWKYYVKHASQWLSPKNVAWSVHANVPPYSIEAVKTGSLPPQVNIETCLTNRSSNLKHFFTTQSKEAPCISLNQVSSQFWKTVENNNRANERRIGKLKGLVDKRLCDNPDQMKVSDMRLRAFLCNAECKL